MGGPDPGIRSERSKDGNLKWAAMDAALPRVDAKSDTSNGAGVSGGGVKAPARCRLAAAVQRAVGT